MTSSSGISTATSTATGACTLPSTFHIRDITLGSSTYGYLAQTAQYSSDTPQSHIFFGPDYSSPDLFNFLTTSYYTNILLSENSQDVYIQPDADGAEYPPVIAFTTPGDYLTCQLISDACILNCNTTSGFTDFALSANSQNDYTLHLVQPSATLPSGAIRATLAAQSAVASPTPTDYTQFSLETDSSAPTTAFSAVIYNPGDNSTLLAGSDYGSPGSGLTIDPHTGYLKTVRPITTGTSDLSVAYIDTAAPGGYSAIYLETLPLASPSLQPLVCSRTAPDPQSGRPYLDCEVDGFDMFYLDGGQSTNYDYQAYFAKPDSLGRGTPRYESRFRLVVCSDPACRSS